MQCTIVISTYNVCNVRRPPQDARASNAFGRPNGLLSPRALTACISVLSVFTCASVLATALCTHLYLGTHRQLETLYDRVAARISLTLSKAFSIIEKYSLLISFLQLHINKSYYRKFSFRELNNSFSKFFPTTYPKHNW